jgi:hypothetical protein
MKKNEEESINSTPSISDQEVESEFEMEEFYEKPVLVGLGLFILFIVATMIINSPEIDEASPDFKMVKQKEQKAEKDSQGKDSKQKNTKKKTSKQKNEFTNQNISKISRLGETDFELPAVQKMNGQCKYSVDASSFQFLSDKAMNEKGLEGLSPIVAFENGSKLNFAKDAITPGCSSSFSFIDATILLHPSQEPKNPSDLIVDFSSKVIMPADKGEMIWIYPGTRVRVKLKETVLPNGPATMIVKGYYVGGLLRLKSKVIQGKTKVEFKGDNDRVSVEMPYEPSDKWTFIIVSVRDFLLIDYIAFRDEKGENVIFQGTMK